MILLLCWRMNFRPVSAGVHLLIVVTAASCGGSSPVAPAPVPGGSSSVLPAGLYNLGTSGGDSSQAMAASCSGAFADWGLLGVIVGADIVLQPDPSGGWIGRTPSTEEGDIELRLQQTSAAAGQVQLRGTLRGAGIHFLDLAIPSGSKKRVAFAGASGDGGATVEAFIPTNVPGLIGTAAGTITFTNAGGHAVSCPKASVLLAPASR
jgi:hypothetical protein